MLRQLHALLAGAGWTTDAPARNALQETVHPLDVHAKTWCLLGGCQRIAWNDPEPLRHETRYQSLLGAVCRQDIDFARYTPARMNDRLGQEAVLGFIAQAIQREEGLLDDL